MDWLNAVAGLFVGVLVGLTGVGGGSLMSPLLILLFGIAPATAIGTDLWFAAITKSVGGFVHHRQETVDMKIVRLLAIGSIPAALITGLWIWYSGIGRIGGGLLGHVLGVVLIITAVATFARTWTARKALSLTIKAHTPASQLRPILTIAAGALLDSKRATLVGEPTYGDAAIRKTITMDDGSAVEEQTLDL